MPNDERRRTEEMHARADERVRNRQEVAPPPPPFDRADRADPADRVDRSERPAQRSHAVEHAPQPAPPRPTGLFMEEEASHLRSRWSDIQAAFVDEPREAVRKADSLVNDVTRRVNEVFTSERAALEKQWDRGDQVTTEDLRVARQRYRSFFDHLLSL
jgi:hypothetical protein